MNSISNNNASPPLCIPLVYSLPQKHVIIFIAIVSMLGVFTTISNTLLIYSLYKTRIYKTITTKFVIAMSLSDLLSAILVMPLLFIELLTTMKTKQCVTGHTLYALNYLGYTFGYFSGFMLFTIAGDFIPTYDKIKLI